MSRKQRRARGGKLGPPLGAGPAEHAPLDDYVDAAASALRLPLHPQWRPTVAANLELLLGVAAAFDEFRLPDEVEPAPVFKA